MPADGYRASFGGDPHVLEFDWSDGCAAQHVHLGITKWYTLDG